MPLGISVVNWMRGFQYGNIKFYVFAAVIVLGKRTPLDGTPLILHPSLAFISLHRNRSCSAASVNGIDRNCSRQRIITPLPIRFQCSRALSSRPEEICVLHNRKVLRSVHFHFDEMCNNSKLLSARLFNAQIYF